MADFSCAIFSASTFRVFCGCKLHCAISVEDTGKMEQRNRCQFKYYNEINNQQKITTEKNRKLCGQMGR